MDPLAVESQGPDFAGDGGGLTVYKFSTSLQLSTAFQISGQMANVSTLPFTAAFSSASMVPGQNIFVTTHSAINNQPWTATTVTLLQQTINGTVSAISSSGSFTTYTISLAAYNLFPNLAGQPGQATSLTNPNTVVVYADSNTQMLNTTQPTVGSVLRFYGLVFDDNGTLRMDCAQVNDGVAE
jgi:threonine/homoserine/homoserine lactone efflux protein